MTTLEQVREFHEAFCAAIKNYPDVSDWSLSELRLNLLTEELSELRDALIIEDKLAALDALIDLQYVLDGTFLALGFAGVKDVAFADVHRSNMSKLGADGKPIMRSDGKILKGPNYTPPNLSQFI